MAGNLTGVSRRVLVSMDDRLCPVAALTASEADPALNVEVVEAVASVSFEGFVQLHGRALIRCAYLVVGSREGAQDVVQVALVKLATRWSRIVAGGDPLPYARTAVVRTAISWRRRRWHGERPDGGRVDMACGDGVEVVETRDRLRRALATLPPRQRSAVVLRHYVDLDGRRRQPRWDAALAP
jgi:RNA polymerase sigma factor (sigma-70 family)